MNKTNEQQVRGTDLKEKMQKSEVDGKRFRSDHQGSDITLEKSSDKEKNESFHEDEEENN